MKITFLSFPVLVIFLLIMILPVPGFAKKTSMIIPLPQHIVEGEGYFELSRNTKILIATDDAGLVKDAEIFNSYIEPVMGFRFDIKKDKTSKNSINLSLCDKLEKEEYKLDISSERIDICGGSSAGVFYALQSLRQLMPPDSRAKAKGIYLVEAVMIHDKPSLGYRGGMLDVVRHFFSADDVKRYIDILALHKMNTFHWHITDDQGWRVELKSYPGLTERGSVRAESQINWPKVPEEYDGIPYGGYYKQDEVKDIIKYAEERHITIIPEIEMPGHATNVLTAYPEVGCTGGPYEVLRKWIITEDIYCAGNEKTFQMLEGILTEIMEIFPSKYIHIGGDEAPKVRWKECPKCQAKIKKEGLANEEELQSYFMKRIEKFLLSKGRIIIGWDDIVEGGVSQTATVMAYRTPENGKNAARNNNNVIMCPGWFCYFDSYQSEDREKEPQAIGGYLPVSKVLSFNPYEDLTDDQQKHILGVECCLFTEFVHTFYHAEYMILPRMAALSEVGWNSTSKDYDNFKIRMNNLVKIYDMNGYNYARHMFTEASTD